MVEWNVEGDHSSATVNGHRLKVHPDKSGTGFLALLEREIGRSFVSVVRHSGKGGEVFDSAAEARAAAEREVEKLL